MNIVSVFESLTVDAELFISPQDLSFCEKLQCDFDVVIKHINECEAILVLAGKKINDIDPKNPFYEWALSLSDDVTLTIMGKRRFAQDEFVKTIVHYFNTKYNLRNVIEDSSDFFTWKAVVDKITDGLSSPLANEGLEKTIRSFHNHLFPEKATIKGATITLPEYRLSGYKWNMVNRFSEGYQTLLKLIGWFETGSLSPLPVVEAALHENLPLQTQTVEVDSLRVKSFKLFKNDRIDITFQDRATAFEFFTATKLTT